MNSRSTGSGNSQTGLVIPVRVRPGASRTAVRGRYDGSSGPALVVAVTARPVDGRASEAVLVAVAKAFGLRRSDVELVTATTARDKRVRLHGATDRLSARFAQLLDE